jgi:hypothetical protein
LEQAGHIDDSEVGFLPSPSVSIPVRPTRHAKCTNLRARNLDLQDIVAEHGQGGVILGSAGSDPHRLIGLTQTTISTVSHMATNSVSRPALALLMTPARVLPSKSVSS